MSCTENFILKLATILKGNTYHKIIYIIAVIGGAIITQKWWDPLLESLLKKELNFEENSTIYGWALLAIALILIIIERFGGNIIESINHRKNQDCQSLKRLLKNYHTVIMQNFIDHAKEYQIHWDALILWEGYYRDIENKKIIFNDQEISETTTKIYINWKRIIEISERYTHTNYDGRLLLDENRLSTENREEYFRSIVSLDVETRLFINSLVK